MAADGPLNSKSDMKIGVLAITNGGKELAGRLVAGLAGSSLVAVPSGVCSAFTQNWERFDGFVCVMAAGIAVRAMAPLLQDKRVDPCVVVVDEKGENAISLLSGHLGGGNALARKVAGVTGGRAVITTASDVLGLTPLDLWMGAQNLTAEDPESVTRASAILVNNGCLRLYSEVAVAALPPGLTLVQTPAAADVIVSERTLWPGQVTLWRPRDLVVGVGCNRGVTPEELAAALEELLAENSFSGSAVRNLATIDLKQDETGLLAFARQNSWDIAFYAKDELNAVAGLTSSAAVFKATGARGVAEPAALLSAATDNLLLRKRKWQNVTLALARANFTLSAQVRVD